MQAAVKPKPRPLQVFITALSWAFSLLLVGFFLFTSRNELLRVTALVLFAVLAILRHRSVRASLFEDCLTDMYRAPGNGVLLGWRTFSTSPEGFVVTGELSESRYPWAVVHRVARTQRHIFVYIAPGLAHPVPLSSQITADQTAEFVAALQRFVPAERFF